MAEQTTEPIPSPAIDWEASLPWTRLFRACRVAIAPSRLTMALLLILATFAAGTVLDWVWPGGSTDDPATASRAYPREIHAYARLDADGFARWRQLQADQQGAPTMGVYQSMLTYKLDTLDEFVSNPSCRVVREAMGTLWGWSWQMHRGYLVTYTAICFLLLVVFGGAIARSTAVDLAKERTCSWREALGYAKLRFWSFLLTPIGAALLVAVPCGLIALGALLFLNVPGLNAVGGLLFVVPLLLALAAVVAAVLGVAASGLFYPAIAVDGSDAFDAISRSYSYVIDRPVRWFGYHVLAVVYGLICYALASLIAIAVLKLTHAMIAWGVFGDNLAQIFPAPTAGQPLGAIAWDTLGWADMLTARLIRFWTFVVVVMPGAFMICYFYASTTMIYQLLRRATDGADYEELDEPRPSRE